MTIDAQMLACVRTEHERLREDLRQIEAGKWPGVTRPEMQALRARLGRLAMLVLLNEPGPPRPNQGKGLRNSTAPPV